MTRNTKRAFTLVELLVTIAIIGILAALLLTAVSSAKLKAQRTHCLSNIKQLTLGSFMYASDNSRHAGIETSAFPGGNWMGTLNEYAKANGILICPSAPLREPTPTSGNLQGLADRAWVRWTSDKKTMFHGSYGYNGWLYSDIQFSEKGDPKQLQVFTSESAIQKPSLTPVFFDENWVDAWPQETDKPFHNLYEGQGLGVSPDQMGRLTIARHGSRSASRAPRDVAPGEKMPGAINMGMADGHTELVKLEDLWKYYWHLKWQPTATIIAGIISANAVQAAPAGLATSISAVAVTKGLAASGSTLTLVKGALKLMAWAKAKVAIATGAAVLLAGGTTVVVMAKAVPQPAFWLQGVVGNFTNAPQIVLIRRTKFPEANHGSSVAGERMIAVNVPVEAILKEAYGENYLRTVKPPNMPKGNFDFLVNLPTGSRTAFQTELKKKFGMTARREVREADVLVLKLKTPDAPGIKVSDKTSSQFGPYGDLRYHRVDAEGYSGRQVKAAGLILYLESRLQKPVVDQTGLTNNYDMDLKWDHGSEAGQSERLKQAVLDQLGIQIVPSRERIEMLIVERFTNLTSVKSLAAQEEVAFAGEFFRVPGVALVNEGGKQIPITISTTQVSEGVLSPTVTRLAGEMEVSRTSYQQLQPSAWFAFVESASRVWIFDGKEDLCVLLMTEKNWTLAEAADPAAPVNLKACPREVRKALPEMVRIKYFNR